MGSKRNSQSASGPFIRVSFADFLMQGEARKSARCCWGNASLKGPADWTGTSSLGDALRLANDGWSDGRQAVGKTIEGFERNAEGSPLWMREIGGEFPDVAAYLAGEPECMMQREDTGNDVPRVRLVLPTAFSYEISAEERLSQAASVSVLLRSLAAQGVAVSYASMQTASRVEDGDADYGIGVDILSFGEPMDIDRLAFTAHPSFLRRIGFAVQEQIPELAWAATRCYGYVPKENDYETVEKIWGVDDLDTTVLLPTADDVADLLKDHDIDRLVDYMEQRVHDRLSGAAELPRLRQRGGKNAGRKDGTIASTESDEPMQDQTENFGTGDRGLEHSTDEGAAMTADGDGGNAGTGSSDGDGARDARWFNLIFILVAAIVLAAIAGGVLL